MTKDTKLVRRIRIRARGGAVRVEVYADGTCDIMDEGLSPYVSLTRKAQIRLINVLSEALKANSFED